VLFFLSCKANARVKLAKTGHGPHSTTLVCICVAPLLCCSMYCLYVNVYCHRATTQMQLINISYIISSHLFFGLPSGRVNISFHLYTFFDHSLLRHSM
jgi:hypothetical protein